MERSDHKTIQRKILSRAQKRLNRLMRMLMKSAHLSKRANSDQNDALEEFLARSLASKMFTHGFSVGPFGLTTPSSTVVVTESSASDAMAKNETETSDADFSNICIGKSYLEYRILSSDNKCCFFLFPALSLSRHNIYSFHMNVLIPRR